MDLQFDCTNQTMATLIDAISWRIDPARARIESDTEVIEAVYMINAEKTIFPDYINESIENLRQIDEKRANIAIREILINELSVAVPLEINLIVRTVTKIITGKLYGKNLALTNEDITDLLNEMKSKADKIKKEMSKRVIEKPIKEAIQYSVSPAFNNLILGQQEIISMISNTATKDDLKNISDNLVTKDDLEDLKDMMSNTLKKHKLKK